MEREILILRPSIAGSVVPETLDVLALRPLGSADDVRNAISVVFSDATWLDPWHGTLDGQGCIIEANMRVESPVLQCMLRISGHGDPSEQIVDLCRRNYWRAIDIQSWVFIE